MKVKVKCSYIIEIDIPPDYYDNFDKEYASLRDCLTFRIEDNGCPGTGLVGAKFDAIYEKCNEESTCWACNLLGENKILEIVE